MEVDTQLLGENKCQIFFCKALDLVDAYRKIGYRLFEPNVRCLLQSSSVNDAIKKSLQTKKGITNFRYLNNGLTSFYESIQKKRSGSNVIKLRKPEIINGLQTLVTLENYYSNMKSKNELRGIFETECNVNHAQNHGIDTYVPSVFPHDLYPTKHKASSAELIFKQLCWLKRGFSINGKRI